MTKAITDAPCKHYHGIGEEGIRCSNPRREKLHLTSWELEIYAEEHCISRPSRCRFNKPRPRLRDCRDCLFFGQILQLPKECRVECRPGGDWLWYVRHNRVLAPEPYPDAEVVCTLQPDDVGYVDAFKYRLAAPWIYDYERKIFLPAPELRQMTIFDLVAEEVKT